jgi:protein tyrosine phosphatase (PTP) superfamily phosphohydrolase (DUF442 family)
MHPLEEIQDFLEISPDLLTAGQPFEEQLLLIQSAGCEVVINLASEVSPDYIYDERARVRSLGMDYIGIPVAWSAPQEQDLKAYFTALEDNRGRKIFVHCARNMRVSAFTFLYRILVLGHDEEVCRADLNLIWQPNEIWEKFITTSLTSFRNL